MCKREYRQCTAEQNLEILCEAEQPGVTASEVYRRHGLSPSALYRWRAVAHGGSAVALNRDAQRALRKDDAETEAPVMRIVDQTKRRSGWQAYPTLAALGGPRGVFCPWERRENLGNKAGNPCRVYEVLPAERESICEFALQYPKIGYRKLTWMMVGAGTVCVGVNHSKACF